MNFKHKNTAAAAGWLLTVVLFTQCTKPNKNDDVVKGDAPPVAGGYTNSSQVAASNLVGYWDFNGNLKDNASGTAATGTNITYATGIKGQAMQGATNGYAIAIPGAAVTGMTSYTVSWWANSPLNTDGIVGMVSFSDTKNFWGNLNTFFENGGTSDKFRFKAIFASNGSTFDFGIQEVTGRWNLWNHFAVTYDGVDKFVIYINGTAAATGTKTGLGPIKFTNFGHIVFGTMHFMTTPSLTSGSTSQPWASYLKGQLDEVRIFNRALTATEVSALTTLEKQGR